MEIRRSIWLTVAAIAILFAVAWHFKHSKVETQKPQDSSVMASNTPPETQRRAAAAAASSAEPISDELKTNYIEYKQGLISKDDLKNDVQRDKNRQLQNFYGKITDQYGQPVTGAEVTGNLEVIGGLGDDAKPATYKTQSDEGGMFQFTGLTGWQLGVTVKKPGYEMGLRGEGFAKALGGQSSPVDRATFSMWRLRGAEPMIHVGFESRIPYDGTPATYDLRTGVKSEHGDLRLTLVRSPQQIAPGLLRPYDWQLKVELVNGEILSESDPYPYWAPDTGYQPFFGFSASSNDIPWSAEFDGKFYIRNAKGQYGRLSLGLMTNSKRSDTGVSVESWFNPSGAHNLEFDPAKQAQ